MTPKISEIWGKAHHLLWQSYDTFLDMASVLSKIKQKKMIYILLDRDQFTLNEFSLLVQKIRVIHPLFELILMGSRDNHHLKDERMKSSFAHHHLCHPFNEQTIKDIWHIITAKQLFEFCNFFSFFEQKSRPVSELLQNVHLMLSDYFRTSGLVVFKIFLGTIAGKGENDLIPFWNRELYDKQWETNKRSELIAILKQKELIFRDNNYTLCHIEDENYVLLSLGECDGAYYVGAFTLCDVMLPLATSPWMESFAHLFLGLFQHMIRVQWEDKLTLLTHIDDVTGLYNQRRLHQDLKKLIERYWRQNEIFTILFIDIDYFKHVNDNHGHVVGSLVLADLALELRRLVRDSDYIYRYGGDEFIIILPHTGVASGEIVATRMLNTIKARELGGSFHPGLKDQTLNLSVSIGVAEFPRDAESYEDIIHYADAMMYQAKREGRGKVVSSLSFQLPTSL